jgi:hypothetical protein
MTQNLLGHEANPVSFHPITNGKYTDPSQAIFPVFKELNGKWDLLGTGFFISTLGIFVSAKHIFVDENNEPRHHLKTLHFFENKSYMVRDIFAVTINNQADVGIGQLQPIHHKRTGAPLKNKIVTLTTQTLKIGEKIFTYAHPITTIQSKSKLVEIRCHPQFYEGKVTEFYPDKRDSCMLPSPCYRTDMQIHGGASGGPVFRTNEQVCGINSSGYDTKPPPISYVSRINEILDLKITGSQTTDTTTIKELIQKKHIILKE